MTFSTFTAWFAANKTASLPRWLLKSAAPLPPASSSGCSRATALRGEDAVA